MLLFYPLAHLHARLGGPGAGCATPAIGERSPLQTAPPFPRHGADGRLHPAPRSTPASAARQSAPARCTTQKGVSPRQ